MCRACQEFTENVMNGKHDNLFPAKDRTPAGRATWLALQAAAWGSFHGNIMATLDLIALAREVGKGPEEVYHVLYQMVDLHRQLMMDTNQLNEKVEDLTAFKADISEMYERNTGKKIEDAINGVTTALVFDEAVLHDAPFVSEDQAKLN